MPDTQVRLQKQIRELQQSQEEMEQLFNLSIDLLCIAGLDGYFKRLNPAWETTLGYTIEEMLSISFLELLHPEDVEATLTEMKHLAEGSKTIHFENRYRCKDSGYKWLAWSCVPVVESGLIYAVARDITELKQTQSDRLLAEKALRESQRLYQMLAELSPVCIVRTDANGHFLYANQRWQEMTGVTVEEARGTGWSQAIHPLDRDRVFSEWYRTIQNKLPFKSEFRFLKPDGTTVWVIGQAQPEIGETGEVIGFVSTITDISSQVCVQQALRISEERLNLALGATEDGLWDWNIVTNQVYYSPRWFSMLGYSEDEIELNANAWYNLVHPDDLQGAIEIINRQFSDPLATNIKEYRLRTKSGEWKWVLDSAQVVERDEKGQPLRMVGTIKDITERKQIELELRDRETRYRLISRATNEAIWDWNLSTNEVQWNDGVEALFGYPIAEVDPTTEWWYEHIHPEDGDRITHGIHSVIDNGGEIWSDEYRYLKADNTYALVMDRGVIARDEKGNPVRMIGSMVDITERKRAELEQQKLVSIVQTSSDLINMASLEGQVLFLNEAGLKILGLSSIEEAKTAHILECVMPQEHQRLTEEIIPTVLQKGFWRSELLFRNFQTNQPIPTDYSVFRIDNPATGEPLCFATISRDITERKQAEEALRQSEAKYRELAERSELINSLTTQIRSSLDLDTILATTVQEIRSLLQLDRCLFIWYLPEPQSPVWDVVHEAKNEDLHSLLGYYPVQATGNLIQNLSDGELYRIDDVSTISDSVEREFFNSIGYTAVILFPIYIVSGNKIGVLSCVSCSGSRHWTDNEVELLSAVSNQLAIAINQAELYTCSQNSAELATAKSQELETALSQLKQTQTNLIQAEKMSSLGQMVAGIAHEINNPVSFIYGNVGHAREYTFDLLNLIQLYRTTYPQPTAEIADRIEACDLDYLAKDLPKLLDSMKVGATRIQEIVKSLRTFSRLDEAEMKEVPLHENLDSTLMILQNRLKENPDRPAISVIKDYGKLPLIDCYAGQLNQVFMNLLSNAIDAIEERNKGWSLEQIKSQPGIIRIKTHVIEKNLIQICISDNGRGINKTAIGRIFDPFYTTKPVGKGTGLGLSISYQIVVEKHQGSLRCASQLGQGTEFIVEIPMKQSK